MQIDNPVSDRIDIIRPGVSGTNRLFGVQRERQIRHMVIQPAQELRIRRFAPRNILLRELNAAFARRAAQIRVGVIPRRIRTASRQTARAQQLAVECEVFCPEQGGGLKIPPVLIERVRRPARIIRKQQMSLHRGGIRMHGDHLDSEVIQLTASFLTERRIVFALGIQEHLHPAVSQIRRDVDAVLQQHRIKGRG